jgi:hypothetical protein
MATSAIIGKYGITLDRRVFVSWCPNNSGDFTGGGWLVHALFEGR